MPLNAGTGRGGTRWYPEGQREAFEDIWIVYEKSRAEIRAGAAEWTNQHWELGPVALRAIGPQVAEMTEWAAGVLGQIQSGDEVTPPAILDRMGSECAELGRSLRGAVEAARAFTRFLLPRLVETYGGEPARLVASAQAMNDLASFGAAVVAEAYLDRKESVIRAREEDLATTLDSIGDAVIVTDAQGRIARMNPVAEQLTGYDRASSLGLPLDDVFRIENEDTGMPVESPVRRVLRDGVVVGLANHTALVSRNGARCPIADSGAPIRHGDGQVRGVVLVFRDVTPERRAEDALRHWERIFQHATWGVATATVDDVRFQAVNPAYAEMHGYTVEELVGAPVSKVWAPETRADMERHARETHQHGRLVVETTHLRKDGSVLPVEVVATTIKDATGKVRWFVANVQDITERRRLQQAQMRAVELEAENRRAHEANRLKSDFLASMSHELRTPLNSIIGFAELVHDEQVGPLEPKQKEFLTDILAGGKHLLRLINDVLDLAKVEAGKMEFRPEPVDLREQVGTVVHGLRAAAEQKRLRVEVSVDPALTDIVLDPVRFKQVLYNYLSNALKFTADGGQVTVRVVPDEKEHFLLEVEDNGVGIQVEDIPRLFVAFQQLDASATRKHGGTGLGLALTKRLAEAQGGTVGVRAAPRRGTVFSAVLPCRPAVRDANTERRADHASAPAMLVVEHDAADRDALVRILTDAGYQVDAVSTCAEAAAAWQRRPYDAVTLDLLLPDANDLQPLLHVVRGDTRRQKAPAIVLTIVGDRNMAAGFAVTDVLTKPVDPAGLLAALERGGAPQVRGKPVLVVDDDVGSLKLMEAVLANLGYDALCFSDAQTALEALSRVRPIAAIVDLIMPGMDGLAFLERFRALPEHRETPVMIWTVKDLAADEQRALQEAVNAIVQKGVDDSSRLSAALQVFLKSHKVGGDGQS